VNEEKHRTGKTKNDGNALKRSKSQQNLRGMGEASFLRKKFFSAKSRTALKKGIELELQFNSIG